MRHTLLPGFSGPPLCCCPHHRVPAKVQIIKELISSSHLYEGLIEVLHLCNNLLLLSNAVCHLDILSFAILFGAKFNTCLMLQGSKCPAKAGQTNVWLIETASSSRREESALHVRVGALQLGLDNSSLCLQRLNFLHQLFQPVKKSTR